LITELIYRAVAPGMASGQPMAPHPKGSARASRRMDRPGGLSYDDPEAPTSHSQTLSINCRATHFPSATDFGGHLKEKGSPAPMNSRTCSAFPRRAARENFP